MSDLIRNNYINNIGNSICLLSAMLEEITDEEMPIGYKQHLKNELTTYMTLWKSLYHSELDLEAYDTILNSLDNRRHEIVSILLHRT